MASQPRKLWVVSQRIPSISNAASSGGLVNALAPLLKNNGQPKAFDQIVLCGYEGEPAKRPKRGLKFEKVEGLDHVIRAVMQASIDEHEKGYRGFLTVKWALAHGLTDKIDASKIEDYAANRKRLRRFAEAIERKIGPNDILWFHDYHNEELADELRALNVQNRIGYFSHIPKERKIDFAKLSPPLRTPLEAIENNTMRAMLAYDLIGVQCPTDLNAFRAHLGIYGPTPEAFDVENTTISGRATKLGIFPASIDTLTDMQTAGLEVTDVELDMISRHGEVPHERAMRVMWAGRADISKNVAESYQLVTQVLRDPDFVRQLKFKLGMDKMPDVSPLQAYGIATETRTGVFGYAEEKQSIRDAQQAMVAELGPQSCVLNESGLPRDILLKAYRGASRTTNPDVNHIRTIGMFLSKRDGQLLGVSEHQASQDPANPMPVIVSHESGISHFSPGALRVNHSDPQECAFALQQACLMSPEEARNRHTANMDVYRRQDAATQIRAFVGHLLSP